MSDKIEELLDGLCLSLDYDGTIGFACRKAMEVTNSTAPIVAILRAQQRVKDLISEMGYDIPRANHLDGTEIKEASK